MMMTFRFGDIFVCLIALMIGGYYLWKNRDNPSRLRAAMVLMLGAVALDMLYSIYSAVSLDAGRSVTIIATHGVIAGVFYSLAFEPGKCEYPAVHHMGHQTRCTVIHNMQQRQRAG